MLSMQANAIPPAVRGSRLPEQSISDARAKTVLVVDDDPAIGQLLLYYLREAGYRPAYVSDGLQALLYTARLKPALVLLDVMLPGLSGWEVCRELRRASEVPIILLTAKNADSDVVNGLGAGANDYITKPFSGAQLLARIERVLRSSAPKRQVQSEQTTNPSVPARAEEQPRSPGMMLQQARRRTGLTLLQMEQRIGVRWEHLQSLELQQLESIPRHLLKPAVVRYAVFLGLDPRLIWERLTGQEQQKPVVRRSNRSAYRAVQFIGAALFLLSLILALYLGALLLLPITP